MAGEEVSHLAAVGELEFGGLKLLLGHIPGGHLDSGSLIAKPEPGQEEAAQELALLVRRPGEVIVAGVLAQRLIGEVGVVGTEGGRQTAIGEGEPAQLAIGLRLVLHDDDVEAVHIDAMGDGVAHRERFALLGAVAAGGAQDHSLRARL